MAIEADAITRSRGIKRGVYMREQTSARAPTGELLRYFDACHVERVGVRAVIRRGKDAALLAALCRSHGEGLVKELIGEFFASRDPWIRDHGYSVGVFVSQASKLLAVRARNARPRSWIEACEELHGGTCRDSVAHMWRTLRDTGE